jgi:hypothetical protein
MKSLSHAHFNAEKAREKTEVFVNDVVSLNDMLVKSLKKSKKKLKNYSRSINCKTSMEKAMKRTCSMGYMGSEALKEEENCCGEVYQGSRNHQFSQSVMSNTGFHRTSAGSSLPMYEQLPEGYHGI